MVRAFTVMSSGVFAAIRATASGSASANVMAAAETVSFALAATVALTVTIAEVPSKRGSRQREGADRRNDSVPNCFLHDSVTPVSGTIRATAEVGHDSES